jgi:hypothetical protein
MTRHTEFSVGVTVWSLEEPEYEPCSELQAICQLLGAPTLTRSPAELYPSNELISSVSTSDLGSILRVDISADPTDQMEVVTLQVRCVNDVADWVEELLRKIHTRSEVETALLRGNLGLPTRGP